MKKRKIAIFIFVLGMLLIVLGISILIYNNLINKKNEQKKLENNIIEKYDIFKKNVESFNELRNYYYSQVVDNLFTETVESDYDNWIVVLDDYTSKVDNVEKSSSYLKKQCVNKYHSNKDVTNKCDSFVIAYETVINYYTKNVVSFNAVLDEYRRENGIVDEESEIKNYSSKYNYVDVNSDGKFIGKD